MEKELYRKNALAMIELVICALHGETPKQELIETLDLEALFEVCQAHLLTACVEYALESAGVRNQKFILAKEKAIRKNILLDAERKKILDRLEEEQIWYMPLKGAVLKDWYPKLGMRQMTDNDILFDNSYQVKVKNIMLELGFTCDNFDSGNADVYCKPPVSNFEMHPKLFTSIEGLNLCSYYDTIKQRLIKDEGNQFGYHFRIEDFYNYLVAHEYKHFLYGGTGVRALIDMYVLLQKWDASMDWAYTCKELKTLGIDAYEQKSREMAKKICERQNLTEEEKQLLDVYIFSGIHGTMENKIDNLINKGEKQSKYSYLFYRFFPSEEDLKVNWKFFYRHKWLLPVLWIYRPFHGLLVNRSALKKEMQYLFKKEK